MDFRCRMSECGSRNALGNPETFKWISEFVRSGYALTSHSSEVLPNGARYYFDVLELNSTLAPKKDNGRKCLISGVTKVDRTQRNHR